MSYPPPSGGFPMYGGPPMPGGGAHYPAPSHGGPALGFDNLANQPPMGTPGVSIGNQVPFDIVCLFVIECRPIIFSTPEPAIHLDYTKDCNL